MTNGEKIKEIFTNIINGNIPVDDTGAFIWWNAEYKEPVVRDNGVKDELEPAAKNDLAQERYQDLIEYFGDEKVAKTILESRKEFKAWLERLRWNTKKVDELARELEQLKPTAKNDLGVDCISRADAIRVASGYCHPSNVAKEIAKLPSVTPQEPQSFKWCTDCKEYDQEKHCCHRWSKVIRDTVEEMKQEQEPCDKCEVGNPCLYCKHEFEPQESEDKE